MNEKNGHLGHERKITGKWIAYHEGILSDVLNNRSGCGKVWILNVRLSDEEAIITNLPGALTVVFQEVCPIQ